eukprot:TRINITY_DN627_c0_g1_i3.p2 TRINITY_DN627_c0_g1~~TRINITY_DN627_c0_g1_i3.p2  ORF type:complete len:603 (-),score=206.75 TRINITY_DN627_c0_g1_i3:2856-4664(-)
MIQYAIHLANLVEWVRGHYALTLVTIAVILITTYALMGKSSKVVENPAPECSGFLPFLLLVCRYFKSPVELIKIGHQKYGNVFTANLFGQKLTFLTGPVAHYPFFKAPDNVLNQGAVYKFTKEVFGENILYDLPTADMIHQLKMLSTALSLQRMRTYVDMMVKESQEYFANWGEEGVIDIRDAMSELTILTASRCLLGKEIRENLHAEVAELYHDLDGGMQPISFFAPKLPIEAHRKRDKARAAMVKIFSKIIAERRKGGFEGEDFLQTLIDSKQRNGEPYNDDQITGLLLLALFAGQHTSSITAAWTGIMLCLHKERTIPRILEEQKKVFTEYQGNMCWESISELEVLHAHIKEALRLFPPLILLMRKVFKDIKIGDYTIPEGNTVFVCPPVAHRNESIFPGSEEYDPDRWLDPARKIDDTSKDTQFSFIGFGGGRHGCMGENFAFMQVKTIWSVLLQNYEFELVDKRLPEIDYTALVIGPKECKIRYKRRKQPLLKTTTSIAAPSKKLKLPTSINTNAMAYDANKPKISKEEVAKHNKEDDCWLIIDNKVYDVTDYAPQHRGGKAIFRNAGGDSTAGFLGPQHPSSAYNLLNDFYIGNLA